MTLIAMVVAGVILSVAPSLAAPPEIEDFCFAQIPKVRPPLSSGRGDIEAFMANCIADLTPPPRTKRNRYKNQR
jgi:hypothetical protein